MATAPNWEDYGKGVPRYSTTSINQFIRSPNSPSNAQSVAQIVSAFGSLDNYLSAAQKFEEDQQKYIEAFYKEEAQSIGQPENYFQGLVDANTESIQSRQESLQGAQDAIVAQEEAIKQDRIDRYNTIRNELETQYNNLVSFDPRLAYQGRAGDLPKVFNQQAAQLRDAGVSSIANLRVQDGKLIDSTTGKTVSTSNLGGQVYVDRDTGVQKWGDIFSGVKGGANYGIQALEDGSVILFPAWEKTKSPIAQIGLGSLEKYIAPILTVAGAYFGAPQLGGALGGKVAGAAAGAAIGNTAGQLLATAEIDWEQVALSGGLAGAGQYVSGLLAPEAAAAGEAAGEAAGTGGVAAGGASVDPESLQALLAQKGVQTAATTAGATAVPGTFTAALPNLLNPVGVLDLPSYGLLDETTFPQDGISTTIPPGGADMGVAQGITVVPPSVPGGAATIAGLEAPGLSGMGGAQGITVPIQGGGVVSEVGFVPPGATPSLGDPGSFINNPDYLGSPVISEDYLATTAADMPSGIDIQDALDLAQKGANLLGDQQQPQGGLLGGGQISSGGRQVSGVDYSGLLSLLQGQTRTPGVASLLTPVVRPVANPYQTLLSPQPQYQPLSLLG